MNLGQGTLGKELWAIALKNQNQNQKPKPQTPKTKYSNTEKPTQASPTKLAPANADNKPFIIGHAVAWLKSAGGTAAMPHPSLRARARGAVEVPWEVPCDVGPRAEVPWEVEGFETMVNARGVPREEA